MSDSSQPGFKHRVHYNTRDLARVHKYPNLTESKRRRNKSPVCHYQLPN